jgi:hypothetical protein
MEKPIKYSEKHFHAGTRICSRETGNTGTVQPDFGDIDHFVNDISELVPVRWDGNGKTCAVFTVYLTDKFTPEFSDNLQSLCDSACWY